MKTIYQLTKSNLSGKRFGLISQMKDAAIGLPSCIAGNHGRRTAKDKKPFIGIAIGLLNATHSQLIVPNGLEY